MTAAATPGGSGASPAAPAKPRAVVHVSWQGEHRFDAGRPGGATLRIDGSGKTGQSPVDAVLSALAACTSTDVVDILGKRRTPVELLEVDATGERAGSVPRRIIAIDLHFRIDGAGVEREQAERAIDLALTKYCSVRDSLDRDIPIRWSLTLNGQSHARGG